MTPTTDRHNYFVFVFAENFPPICVGAFSAESPSDARSQARAYIQHTPKYQALIGLTCRYQTAKAV